VGQVTHFSVVVDSLPELAVEYVTWAEASWCSMRTNPKALYKGIGGSLGIEISLPNKRPQLWSQGLVSRWIGLEG
jgi:hypothetical protein